MQPARSPASRYRRLSEYVQADGHLIEPFLRLAGRVAGADRVRLRGLAYVRDLSEGDVDAAIARVAENRCLVAWVRVALDQRASSYRFAREHLLFETPQGQALPAERALNRFEAHLAVSAPTRGLEACAGDAVAPVPESGVLVIVE